MNEENSLEFRKCELFARGLIFVRELENEEFTQDEIIHIIISLLTGSVEVYDICTEDLERIFNQIRKDTESYRNYWEQCG